MTILILEDDTALCKGIALALAAPDRSFLLCGTVAEARSQLQSAAPDAFILDINLPDGSGLDFCGELRAAGYDAPILIGVPIGLLAGYFSGVSLTPLMLNIYSDLGGSSRSANPLIFVFAAAFSLLTVFIGCRKPGKIAARVSPGRQN